jgi:Resolvase, N terminal domain
VLSLPVLPGAAQAQDGRNEADRPPTELWKEYPLNPSPSKSSPRRSPPAPENSGEGARAGDGLRLLSGRRGGEGKGGGGVVAIVAVGLVSLAALALALVAAKRLRGGRARRPGAAVPRGPVPKERALGYASPAAGDSDVTAQVRAIEAACAERGLDLVRVVRDLEPPSAPGLDRPGLIRTLERLLFTGEANCLVLSGLERPRNLGRLIEVCERNGIRLVIADIALDTGTERGRLGALRFADLGTRGRTKTRERARRGGIEAT